jgi:D-tyrosyl-tRNA(Tyr) deacylase
VEELGKMLGKEIKTGKFGADMSVELINDGPTNIIMDSKNKDF